MSEAAHPIFRDGGSKRYIVFRRVNGLDRSQGEADADGEDGRSAGCQRPVEIAATITKPVACGIEADQRQQRDGRHEHLLRVRYRDAMAVDRHVCSRRPWPEHHGGCGGDHDRHRGLPAGGDEAPDGRLAIDLGAYRRAKRDDARRVRQQPIEQMVIDAPARGRMFCHGHGHARREFFTAQPGAEVGGIQGGIKGGMGGLIGHGA